MGPMGPAGPQGPAGIASIILGNIPMSDLAVGYSALGGGSPLTGQSANAEAPAPMACTFVNLNVLATSPAASSAKLEVTLMVDGLTTALWCRASFDDRTSTRCSDQVTSVAIKTGQTMSMRVRYDAPPPQGAYLSWGLVCK
jgi:hypothetical protein